MYVFIVLVFFFFFFFFQAEDCIRDPLVTGVQTCALPIYMLAQTSSISSMTMTFEPAYLVAASRSRVVKRIAPRGLNGRYSCNRSEERRVGKECRSRRSTYD